MAKSIATGPASAPPEVLEAPATAPATAPAEPAASAEPPAIPPPPRVGGNFMFDPVTGAYTPMTPAA